MGCPSVPRRRTSVPRCRVRLLDQVPRPPGRSMGNDHTVRTGIVPERPRQSGLKRPTTYWPYFTAALRAFGKPRQWAAHALGNDGRHPVEPGIAASRSRCGCRIPSSSSCDRSFCTNRWVKSPASGASWSMNQRKKGWSPSERRRSERAGPRLVQPAQVVVPEVVLRPERQARRTNSTEPARVGGGIRRQVLHVG